MAFKSNHYGGSQHYGARPILQQDLRQIQPGMDPLQMPPTNDFGKSGNNMYINGSSQRRFAPYPCPDSYIQAKRAQYSSRQQHQQVHMRAYVRAATHAFTHNS